MSTDPYAAPKTHVADLPEVNTEGNFVPEGRSRTAGAGWAWIKSARGLTKTQIWLWIGIFIVFGVIMGALSSIPTIGPFALYIVMPVLFGGLMLGCDAVYKGDRMTFGHLFSGFRSHFGKLVAIGLATLVLYAIVFAIVAAIFGTGLALGLSGIEKPDFSDPMFAASFMLAVLVMLGLSVPVYMAIWFSYPLIVINDLGVIQAFRTSFFACLKNVVPFFVYGVMTFLLAIVATIPLGLGWLILAPIMLASFYTAYRDVFYET